MILLETQTILPFSIEAVYALTVDLEQAPRWHAILTVVQQLTTPPIGMGTQWKMHYEIGSFVLEITDYQPPHRVTFQGSNVIGGTIPNFTIELQTVTEETQVRYLIHPRYTACVETLDVHYRAAFCQP